MPELDQGQKFFLRMIEGFSPEDIRDAIMIDADLATLLINEYGPEMLEQFKSMVMVYDKTHPGVINSGRRDFGASASRVVDWLKDVPGVPQVKNEHYRALAFEIEAFSTYPTALNIGLVSKNGEAAAAILASQTQHVGLTWVAKNLESLARLLL